MEFSQVQKDVAEILKGRLLVGHALENDLKVFTIWAMMQKNLSSGFPTKWDSNQSAQLQRLAKIL